MNALPKILTSARLAVALFMVALTPVAAGPASAQDAPAPAAVVAPRPPPSMSAFYPDRAQRMNQGGRVLLGCATDTSDQLNDCRVIMENPRDWGFGEAALKAARAGSLPKPKIVEKTKDGRTLVTVNFNVPQ